MNRLISTQMSEEVAKSSVTVPRSMVLSILINGTLGLPMVISMLYCAGDLETLLESGTQFPFMLILANAMGNGAATALVAAIIVLNACGVIAALSSGSRMMWSFAREQALPGWSWLRKVRSSSKTLS